MAPILSRILAVLTLPLKVIAVPLQPRAVQSIGYIDPSTDEWSSTLSGIGPLILLIGERSTKQLLRNVRSVSHAFSLAAAPLGLLSVVTSLIRFCGVQRLRAFIGYELEARTVAGIEVTRVNCGGVHAHLTDGYVARSIASNPASQLVAVSILEGTRRDVSYEAVSRVRAIEGFEEEKRSRRVPEGIANVEWCLHIVLTCPKEDCLEATAKTLSDVIGIPRNCAETKEFLQGLKIGATPDGNPDGDSQGPSSQDVESNTIKSSSTLSRWEKLKTAATFKESSTKSGNFIVSVLEVVPTLRTISEKSNLAPIFWDFTFMSTFDAVSEFTAGVPTSDLSAATIGFISALAIVTIHILALWHNSWTMSVAWILVVLGYCGIVFGVCFAAMLINWSCTCIKLENGSSKTSPQWKEGMVVSVKNTDSMDTSGSNFVSSPSQHQNLEAVWINSATNYDKSLATLITMALVVSFIAHYLGLRAIIWWASIGELGVCIAAAFARSVSNEVQPRFEEAKGVKIDKRCMSTGVIRTQTSKLVTEEDIERSLVLDARAYSLRALNLAPTVGERLAYLTAKLCLEDSNASEIIHDLTGMNLRVLRAGQPDGIRGILTFFSGGILVTEGLASPNAQVCIAFRAECSDLAAPTSLLARAIMRQPEWKLKRDFAKGIPLGNVYIFAMQSMLDWWTLSEDRNDMGDLQRNLHWPFFLVNVAFFIQLIRCGQKDEEILTALEEAHGSSGKAEGKAAADIVGFIGRLPCSG